MRDQEIELDAEIEITPVRHLLFLTGEDFFGFEGEIIEPLERSLAQLQLSIDRQDNDFVNHIDNL